MTDLDNFEEFQPEWRKTDRKRGILTEKDREYLVGEFQPEGQDERNTRYRIRQRLGEAFHDIRLLRENLSDDDLKQLTPSEMRRERVAIELMALAYRVNRVALVDGEEEVTEEDLDEKFEVLIKSAIESHLDESGMRMGLPYRLSEDENPETISVSVDLIVEINEYDLAEIFEKLKTGTATRGEFLFWMREADPEVLREHKEKDGQALRFEDPELGQTVSADIDVEDMGRYSGDVKEYDEERWED